MVMSPLTSTPKPDMSTTWLARKPMSPKCPDPLSTSAAYSPLNPLPTTSTSRTNPPSILTPLLRRSSSDSDGFLVPFLEVSMPCL